MDITKRLQEAFEEQFGGKPDFIVRAPGRVNLIGEHTDYNDGFVLPMAIDRAVWIALRPRRDRRVFIHSMEFEQTGKFSLDRLRRGKGWIEYIKGMAWALESKQTKNLKKLTGWEGVLTGDVPRGAGLSSSAAVEMATARAFAVTANIEWNPNEMALAGQRCENGWIGVKSGIMDQMVSAAAKDGHALFLDCRSLEYEHVPLPDDVAVVVLDTATRRGLVESAYNERRGQCETAAQVLGLRALRDAEMEDLQKAKDRMDTLAFMRARHIVTENQRVLDAISAMRVKDMVLLGNLLNESHISLRDDFEVTNDALNWIVGAAQAHSACYGARMTGAGFGGCAVALVEREKVGEFVAAVETEYRQKSGLDAGVYVCHPSAGASVSIL